MAEAHHGNTNHHDHTNDHAHDHSHTHEHTHNHKSEEFRVHGDELLSKVRQLINEGNVRRIIIKNKDGKSLVELPLTIGVVGAVLAPPLAAVGAIAALVTECTILVERDA